MRTTGLKILKCLGLLWTFTLFSANHGCEEALWCAGLGTVDVLLSVDDWDTYDGYNGCPVDYFEDPYERPAQQELEKPPQEETFLIVVGEGDELVLKYGALRFPARKNLESGLYEFQPGSLCTASIDEEGIHGDCSEADRSCSFGFDRVTSNESDRLYRRSLGDCQTSEVSGPFSVP